MRSFARPTSLDRLSLEARVIYTAFCLFMLLGYASSIWLYADDAIGMSPNGAERYYLGEADKADTKDQGVGGGPSLDLPSSEEESAEGLRLMKPPRQVIETFHFHLFSVPVCLLIISHIFMMTSLSTRVKTGVIALASLATLVHLAAPPLIRFVSGHFSVLMFPSAALMGGSWIYMTVQPIAQMWLGKGKNAG